MNKRLPVVFVFICTAIAAMIFVLHRSQPAYDLSALLIADVVMLVLALGAWAMLRRNVGERAHAFARGVQGATMLRLFVCAAGILSYALIRRPHVHKPTLFVMFGIYAIYTIIETVAFSQQARKV